jgi:serine/threonine-protein kinase
VHRDVSPQNVLVTYDGVVKVVDFGVAKATARLDTQTEAGQLKGKIAYMSPEQLRGEKIDRRTDVFAMGILLYMMTTGKHPFRGDDQAQTIARISSDEPAILPSALVPGYPPGLEAVVMQALAKDSAKRYPSANDMLIGLTRALPSAMRESTDEEVSEFVRRLLPDRLERQKQAIKQALEQADRREASRSTPQLNLNDGPGDEPATVLEGIGREMTPSADGRSLPGASSTEPPPSFARPGRRRRLALAFGAILLIGGAVGFLFGHGERARPPAAVSPLPPAPKAAASAPGAETPPVTNAPSPLPPLEAPTETAPAPSASASTTPAVRPAGGRRSPIVAKPVTSSTVPHKGPFVSPIRNPGF